MLGISTSDQLFTLRQILENIQEHQVDTHHLFIDFRQAYDTPTRDELYHAMNQFGNPEKLIRYMLSSRNDANHSALGHTQHPSSA